MDLIMLDTLKSFFKELSKSDTKRDDLSQDETRLAVAALLFHIIAVDGVVEDSELDSMREVIKKEYNLTPDETEKLIEAAKERDEEAVDLYSFTSLLKHNLEEEERKKIIELMWEMVFADGTLHEFEDNTIWRVAELLGVSSRDRMILKHKVASTLDNTKKT